MKNTGNITFEFFPNDFWFLLKLFSQTKPSVMENPQSGWLIEEIEQADQEAVDHLVEKKLAVCKKKNSLEIDDLLYVMVQTIVQPEYTLSMQNDFSKNPQSQHTIFFSGDRTVAHVTLADGNHQITAIRDQAALLYYLALGTKEDEQVKPVGNQFIISEEILFKAAEEYTKGNHQAGENILKESNLKKNDLQALHEALSNTLMNRSFALIKNQEKPGNTHISGFGILQGEKNLWLLEPVNQMGKSIIHFIPATIGMVSEKLIDILPC